MPPFDSKPTSRVAQRCSTYRLLVLAMVAALGLLGCRSAQAEDPLGGVVLTSQQGTPVDGSKFRDKTLVLSFFFTSCPQVCPAQAKVLRETWQALPGEVRKRVEFLSVSVDPDNDTPEALARFARTNGLTLEGFTLARTTEEQTSALTKRFAAFDTSRPGGASPSGHTTSIYLFDSHGQLKQRYGGGTDPRRLAREIQQIDTMFRSNSMSRSDI